MECLAQTFLITLSFALAGYVVIDYLRGKSDLVSVRNVAVGGFVLFQTLSAGLWLIDDKYELRYFLLDPGATGMKFAIAATLFAIVALAVYRSGFIARPIARLIPKPGIVPSDGTMLLTALVLTVSAAVFRFAVFIPYVAVLASMLGTAVAGASAGLAGWMIGRNLRNPIIWALAGAVILANLGVAITGTFGRRTIISIGLGVAFGLYYGRLRYESPRRTVSLLLLAAVPLALFLAAFTSVRGGDNRRANAFEVARNIFSGGSIKKGLEDVDGQGTGGVSLWLMEFFGPDGQREPETLRAFQYFVLFPAPRAVFPFKPEPLSLDIPRYANLEGVNIGGLTIGPGIIGHAFADGGWIVLIFYASFGGFILRFGDEIIQRSPHAPFVVLPMGSMLGEIMGVPRGESSAMLFQFVFGTASCYAYVAGVGKALEYFGYAQKGDADLSGMGPAGWELEDDDGYDPDDPHHDPYAEYSDYGSEYGDEYSDDDRYGDSDEPAA
ncbi:MAG: hypothetical protein AAF235_04190 [Planctomycetota bacterium]